MITDFEFEYRLFPPSAAERITGVSAALQRDWRRRRILPESQGHARFELSELAEMHFLWLMTQRGIGPLDQTAGISVAAVAPAVGARIAIHVLRSPEAWSGDLTNAPGRNWGEKAKLLTQQIYRSGQQRFFAWLADGTHEMNDNIRNVFDNRTSLDPGVAGPVIVLDLDSIAAQLTVRAGTPFIHVTKLEASGPE
jgi:hypothetical protein